MKSYKIYINQNTLYITDTQPKQSKKVQELDSEKFDLPSFFKAAKDVTRDYVLVHSDPQWLFKKIKKSCQLIKAAGGLVMSGKGNYLFIFRNKKWDLPKGKVEKGEKMKDAGVREVEEECGVKIMANEGKICKTYHIYALNNKVVLKKTNWYSMSVKGEPKLIPQKEEGITEAVWLAPDELKPVLKNTFPSIKQVLEEANLL